MLVHYCCVDLWKLERKKEYFPRTDIQPKTIRINQKNQVEPENIFIQIEGSV